MHRDANTHAGADFCGRVCCVLAQASAELARVSAKSSGWLWKRGEHGTVFHQRWFELDGFILRYYLFDRGQSQYSGEPRGQILITSVRVVDPQASATHAVEHSEHSESAFHLESDEGWTYVLAAESAGGKEFWTNTITEAQSIISEAARANSAAEIARAGGVHHAGGAGLFSELVRECLSPR